MIKTLYTTPKGKVIRDHVHGDIFLPEIFINIIDTPEFQRLRRIKQLAVAHLLFPGAEHTRFAHSLGTYYVMEKIINHFEKHFSELNLPPIKERDKQVALVAALLHDIGHGPFSHAFEKSLPEGYKSINHEQWTMKIISDRDSNINKVLVENFDANFPLDVVSLISKVAQLKEEPQKGFEYIDLNNVLSSLISGQLDADRMDYLLRDTLHTGVSFGRVDISRIINSMRITVSKDRNLKDNYFVCIPEKYVPDIENYLFARYQMFKSVYHHEFKCEMEMIIKKILSRAIYLYEDKLINESEIPESLKSIFRGEDLSVSEYCMLDDSVLSALFNTWRTSDDVILSNLCRSLIDRNKFTKLRLLDDSNDNIISFKDKLKNILNDDGYKTKSLKDEYFWLENQVSITAYNNKKDYIYILCNNGILKDLSEVSTIIKKGEDSDLKEERNMTFINLNILKEIITVDLNQIHQLVQNFDSRNYIEIEKKYFVKDESTFLEVKKSLKNTPFKYEIICCDVKSQEDYYYDTDDSFFVNKNSSLRVRSVDGKRYLTIKTPTSFNIDPRLQSERFEFEIEVSKNDPLDSKFIQKNIPDFPKDKSLSQVLKVTNLREKIKLKQGNVQFEVVFDNVNYENAQGDVGTDFQVEIELKSDYGHRVNLKLLTDYLEEQIQDLNPTSESKFKRGLSLTNK